MILLVRCVGKNTETQLQEKEGPELVEHFLKDIGLTIEEIDRVSFLVGHHHTYTDVDKIDYQILLESDYLVNADESNYTIENIKTAAREIFRTKAGIHLLKEMYSV